MVTWMLLLKPSVRGCVGNAIDNIRLIQVPTIAASWFVAATLVCPLTACARDDESRQLSNVQFAALDVAKRTPPPPPKRDEPRRKNRPSSKSKRHPQEVQLPSIKAPGSGDPLPMASYSPVVPGVSVATGALPGGAIGGLAGAIWADQNGDGYVDGYTYNNQYYAGTPAGYDNTLGRVATGAVGGAALGAVAGAVIPGVSVIQGAVIGAAVGGLAGAVWADQNGDGQVDGYYYNQQYYPGQPQGTTVAPAPMPVRSGERG
jgi:hypothetical protein